RRTATSEVRLLNNPVSTISQLGAQRFIEPCFHSQLERIVYRRWVSSWPAGPAGLLNCRLHVVTGVDQASNRLQVPLRLTIASWCAANQNRNTLLVRNEIRIERMHGSLAGLVNVGMRWIKREATPGA